MSSRVGGAVLQHSHCVVEVREEQGIDDEAGAVRHLDGALAALFGEFTCRGDRFVACGQRANDFDQLHHMSWVEEVNAANAVWPLAHRCHFYDRERRGIRGEDRVFAADRIETCEQVLFDLEVFDNGFDDEIGVRQFVQIVGSFDPGQNCRLVGFFELAAPGPATTSYSVRAIKRRQMPPSRSSNPGSLSRSSAASL